ncbi:MAG: efflux RND transporter periplasmic adaptor subunit [Pseudomonadota bacterium]
MKSKYAVTIGLTVVVVVWMLLPRERGLFDDGFALPENDTTVSAVGNDGTITNDNQSFTVRVARINAQDYQERVRVRGQTKAFRHVDVRAEVSGRVVATPVARGARVNAGDLLCEIAVDTRAADLQEARSRQEEAQLEYNGALDLQERGLQSRVSIAQMKAALDSSTAAVTRAELNLNRTRITAPFAGIMETRAVEVGNLMDMGGTCASLLDDSPMLLIGQVPETDVGKLTVGADVSATLLSGETVAGKLTYVSRAADTSARSYGIEVEIDSGYDAIRQGITAEIYIAGAQTRAHLIPPSALTLNDEGIMGVKTLDQNNVVQFSPVTVIGENTSVDPGMWVLGLPEQSVVITLGQEIVFPGQPVSADFSWSTSNASAQ